LGIVPLKNWGENDHGRKSGGTPHNYNVIFPGHIRANAAESARLDKNEFHVIAAA
jgi:hypothetical protein